MSNTPWLDPWPETVADCEADPNYELYCYSFRHRGLIPHDITCYRYIGPTR